MCQLKHVEEKLIEKIHLLTLGKFFLAFSEKVFGTVVKSVFYVFIRTFLGEQLFRIFFLFLGHLAKMFRLSVEKLSMVSSQLPSTCPKENFKANEFFRKKILIFFGF